MKPPQKGLPTWNRNFDCVNRKEHRNTWLYMIVILVAVVALFILGNVYSPVFYDDYQVFERVNTALRLIQ